MKKKIIFSKNLWYTWSFNGRFCEFPYCFEKPKIKGRWCSSLHRKQCIKIQRLNKFLRKKYAYRKVEPEVIQKIWRQDLMLR
ncbi:MAG TPA: hypothetical protein ENJ27_02335 [Candidatus Moranbacteria bacterium]|nr:hypothetical protein [Candidatus Moranbacteria bacterium]